MGGSAEVELNSAEDLPGYLVEVLPEAVGAVEEVRLEYRDEPAIRMYGYVSLGFWWPVFEPALRDGVDLELVGRCFRVVEAMVSCPDREVTDPAVIRVIPYLLDPAWRSLVGRYAGPVTLAEVRAQGFEFVAPVLSGYAAYLVERFPEWRDAIDESRVVDRYVVGTLTRDVLVGVLRNAVEAGDDELLERWYQAVDDVLASADDELTDVVLREVPRAAWETVDRARAQQCGPLLVSAIDDRYGTGMWRAKGDWADEVEPRTKVSVEIYRYDGELLMHGRRYSRLEETWPAVGPFARTPAASTPDEVGAVVAGLLTELAEDSSEPVHSLNEFLQFAGGLDWPTLYSQSVLVTVEHLPTGDEVQVWSHEGTRRAGLFVSRPVSEPISANVRRSVDLGTAVQAALRRSSTTG